MIIHLAEDKRKKYTFPELWRTVVRFLQCLSRPKMSLVTSRSKSSAPRSSDEEAPAASSLSPLIVFRFVAKRLALIAAIFSIDMASESELNETVRRGREREKDVKLFSCASIEKKYTHLI